MTTTRERLLALSLSVLMVVSVLTVGISTVTTDASAAGNQGQANFHVVDAFSSSGNMVVAVQATGQQSVDDFNVWYNDTTTQSEVGPLTFGNGGITAGMYDDQRAFGPSDSLDASSGRNGVVLLTLDSAQAPYTTAETEIRVTANGNSDYDATPVANRSLLTANSHTVSVEDTNGNALGATPLLLYDESTNETLGMAITDTNGEVRYHCGGEVSGGTCTVPGTSQQAPLYVAGSANPLRGTGVTALTTSVTAQSFDLARGLQSSKTTLSPGTTTLTADSAAAPTFYDVSRVRLGARAAGDGEGGEPTAVGGSNLQMESVTVTDQTSDAVVYRWNNSTSAAFRAPVFLKPTEMYTFSMTVSRDGTTVGTYNRTVIIPTRGMQRLSFLLNTQDGQSSVVTGQVRNETGDPVSNAVVYAEQAGSGGNSIRLYNSSTTDANGMFSMRLPETDSTNVEYSFRIVSNETSGSGTLKYYPTVVDNDGRGYDVRSGKTVLPALTLKEGGRIDIAVQPNQGSKLPTSAAYTQLSQSTNATHPDSLTASTSTFSEFQFGNAKPSSGSIVLASPTSGQNTSVFYNTWGLGETRYLCAESVSVSQGQATSSTCTLEQAGTLDLTVQRYGSILERDQMKSEPISSSRFFFENRLVVRNASTDDIVTVLGPRTGLQYFMQLDGGTSQEIPLPAGDYTLELHNRFGFPEQTNVDNSTTITVQSGQTTSATLSRGTELVMEPERGRFDPALTRSSANTVSIRVGDEVPQRIVSDADVSVYAHFEYPNGTVASDVTELTYNSSGKPTAVFDTKSLTPKDLGVGAGVYELAVTATNRTSSATYNSTERFRVRVSDFQMRLEPSRRVVGSGDTVTVRASAYDTTADPPTGLDAAANDIAVELYDENGKRVKTVSPSSGISNGQGTFQVTVPDDEGNYRLSAVAETSSGDEGLAEAWLKVSDVEVDASTNKDVYRGSDTIGVTVDVVDAAAGNAITNASVTARLNGQQTSTTTDANGRATFSLDPSTYARGGNSWSGNQFVQLTVTVDEGTGISRTRTGVGVEVRALNAHVEPSSPSFGPDENVRIDVFAPPTANLQGVEVTQLDGKSVSVSGTSVQSGFYQVDLGKLSTGTHTATVEVTGSSGSVTRPVQFEVRSHVLDARPSKYRYEPGETITVDATVKDTDGTPAANEQVNVTLFAAGSPPRKVDSASGTTGSDGVASVSGLSADGSGPHFLEVEVGGQTVYRGIQVSDLNVELQDANGDRVDRYQFAPGETGTVHVEATKSDGSAVADGTQVKMGVFAYGEVVKRVSGTTSDGTAALSFDVPSSVPEGRYGMGVEVQTDAGGVATTFGTLEISGGDALSIEASTDRRTYAPGATATMSATVTYANGTGAENEQVEFFVTSEGSSTTKVGTVATAADGTAQTTYTVPSGTTDGEYVLHARLKDSPGIQSFNGYRVSRLNVRVSANESSYTPGDTIGLTVNVTDSTTGATASATAGGVRIVSPDGTQRTSAFTPSGTAPYTVNVSIPEAGAEVGTQSISVFAKRNDAVDVDSTLVEVRSDTESVNMTVPERITTGQAATVTVNGTLDATANLTVFSPGAASIAHDSQVAVKSDADTTTDVTLSSPGTYVFKLTTPSVGTVTKVRTVQPSATDSPDVFTGTNLSTNATSFNTSEGIYIMTNTDNATATVIGNGSTYTVELNRESGDVNYGVLTQSRSAGVYLVRLDTANATDVNATIIEVGA